MDPVTFLPNDGLTRVVVAMPLQLELDAERALRRETQQEALRNRSVCYCRTHVDAPASAHRPSPPTLPTLLGVSCFVGA